MIDGRGRGQGKPGVALLLAFDISSNFLFADHNPSKIKCYTVFGIYDLLLGQCAIFESQRVSKQASIPIGSLSWCFNSLWYLEDLHVTYHTYAWGILECRPR